MSRLLLQAAILLLAVWIFTPAGIVHATSDGARYTQPEPSNQQSQPAGAGEPVRMVEGCLTNIDDAFILTDEKGRTYELSGDTAQLLAHSGTQVRLWGHTDNVMDAEQLVAAGPIRSFNVVRARSLSSGCPTRRT